MDQQFQSREKSRQTLGTVCCSAIGLLSMVLMANPFTKERIIARERPQENSDFPLGKATYRRHIQGDGRTCGSRPVRGDAARCHFGYPIWQSGEPTIVACGESWRAGSR